MKNIFIILFPFFSLFILSSTKLFAGIHHPWQLPLLECLDENPESGYKNNSTNKKHPDTKDIHEINFKIYLRNMAPECIDIDSNYTVSIISLLYFDLNKDGKDEAIITAQTCMMGNGGPDIHGVYYLDASNNIGEYNIDYKPKKHTKIIGIPLHLIGNRNYILKIQDSMLCAEYWDGSGRKPPLLQYFKFDNGKFILEKEVYGKTFPTSFDCNKARSDREIVTCSCDSIAEMDIELNSLYRKLISILNPDKKNKLKKEQKQWLENFDKVNAYRWLDEFSERYKARIAELKNILATVK